MRQRCANDGPYIKKAGPILIVSNHSHRSCKRHFGLLLSLAVRTNFYLFLSPKIAEEFQPLDQHFDTLFFTRGDGDGPVNLCDRDEF